MSRERDTRRYPCPSCGETVLAIGQQCGFCGKICTEQRVREADVKRKKALLAIYNEPRGEELQCRMML